MRKRLRSLALGAAVSSALSVPCFWQPRLQTQDLASHVYNAWLAREVMRLRPPGLEVKPQLTNIVFDVLLDQATERFGYQTGPKVLMAVLVLAFFWFAWAFVRRVGNSTAAVVWPLLAMLAYGWTFHMGFGNFYLASALAFLYLSLVWTRQGISSLWVLPILAGAAAAHFLPALWAGGVHLYRTLFFRIPPPRRPWLAAFGATVLIGTRLALEAVGPVRWEPAQILFASGLDQCAVFGWKYLLVLAGLLYLWGYLLYRESQKIGLSDRLRSPLFHVGLLTAAAVVILPNAVMPDLHLAPFSFITQRMSLWVAVILCASLPRVDRRRAFAAASGALVALYFSFLYADSLALNALEDRVETLVRTLPSGARVISGLTEKGSRTDPLLHMVDRACLGHCYSYANYEPASGHFRVRATGPNPWALHRVIDINAVTMRGYVVRPEDGILHQIRACRPGTNELCLARLEPGQTAAPTPLQVLPWLW